MARLSLFATSNITASAGRSSEAEMIATVGIKMREGELALFFGVGLILLSPDAHAGSPPKELYGKSITLQWTESRTGKVADQPTTRTWGKAITLTIYISTAGRPFHREFGSTIGGFNPHGITNNFGQVTSDVAPGESKLDHFDFQGRSVVVYKQFQSGVRRIAIDLDASGTSCKGTVINGKESGKSILRTRGEIVSTQIGAVNCSIKEGNLLGQ
jgi:hypothetical protein